MVFRDLLEKIAAKNNLTRQEAAEALELIIREELTPTEIGAFLFGLRVKGESADELLGFLDTMEKHMIRVELEDANAIDVCGTGGDGKHTFNVSTTVAIVAAGGGVTVAKHGNRSVSSKSGSADVLEKLGIRIDLTPEQTLECINTTGLGFFFAPHYHPAMKMIVPHRKNLAVRTFFNIMGPLLNPAGVKRQIIGTYDAETARKLAEVLQKMDFLRACTVYSEDGFDEVSPFKPSMIFEVEDGRKSVKEYQYKPPAFVQNSNKLAGGDSKENAKIILDILRGAQGPERQITVLNSAFAFYVSGMVDTVNEGVELAKTVIDSGSALTKLKQYKIFTDKVASKN